MSLPKLIVHVDRRMYLRAQISKIKAHGLANNKNTYISTIFKTGRALLPAVAAAFSATACVLLAAECAADLSACSNYHTHTSQRSEEYVLPSYLTFPR